MRAGAGMGFLPAFLVIPLWRLYYIEELKGTEGGRLVVAVASTGDCFAIRMLAEFCRRYPKRGH